MSSISLAIVTDDAYYGEALSRAFSHVNRSLLSSIFAGDDFLKMWKSEGNGFRENFDLILWDGNEIRDYYGGNLVWLRETPASGQEEDQRFQLPKYAPASTLAARVLDLCGQLKGGEMSIPDRGNTEMVAFASWQGGAGCTTVANAIGQELTRFYGKRVLYLTLEEIEGTAVKSWEEQRYVSEFLYRFFEGGACRGLPMEAYLHRDAFGMERLVPTRGRNPLAYLTREDMEGLLSNLGGQGFDVILFDVGTGCGEAALAVIAAAETILLLWERDEPEREERYRRWLELESGEKIRGKIRKVRNRRRGPHGSCGPDEVQDEAQDEGCSLFVSPHPMLEEGKKEVSLLEGDFGRDIHALAEKICYNQND